VVQSKNFLLSSLRKQVSIPPEQQCFLQQFGSSSTFSNFDSRTCFISCCFCQTFCNWFNQKRNMFMHHFNMNAVFSSDSAKRSFHWYLIQCACFSFMMLEMDAVWVHVFVEENECLILGL
jgi:hypothetical protein